MAKASMCRVPGRVAKLESKIMPAQARTITFEMHWPEASEPVGGRDYGTRPIAKSASLTRVNPLFSLYTHARPGRGRHQSAPLLHLPPPTYPLEQRSPNPPRASPCACSAAGGCRAPRRIMPALAATAPPLAFLRNAGSGRRWRRRRASSATYRVGLHNRPIAKSASLIPASPFFLPLYAREARRGRPPERAAAASAAADLSARATG